MKVMIGVKAKKKLGQHFLTDRNIAGKIVDSLLPSEGVDVLEIGPGMGILTRHLLDRDIFHLKVVEIDREAIEFMNNHFPVLHGDIIAGNFLHLDLRACFPGTFAIIGNFPYNISSQIFFHILEYRDIVTQVVCMLQKEVAQRLCSGPGSKNYGILSVLLQAYYNVEYLFSVPPEVFVPPPAVQSGVIRLVRNERHALNCDQTLFIRIVKAAFNQRRKKLSNSLRAFLTDSSLKELDMFSRRPEQLAVSDFERLTMLIDAQVAGPVP